MNVKITGIGSYIPQVCVDNSDFLDREFYDKSGNYIADPNEDTVRKLQGITGIEERRYAKEGVNTSDMAFEASKKAIEDAEIDPEELDYIILAHNFGDVPKGTSQSDMVPSLSTRVKNSLKIKKPSCVAYDMVFGCPGWLESMIQGEAFIKTGLAGKCLIIGAEALSRVVDQHDRDSMIFSDGAGAAVIESSDEDSESGIVTHKSASYSYSEAYYLGFRKSYNPNISKIEKSRYIKMEGRKIYNFALTKVPQAMKDCLDESGVDIKDVKKIFMHQANAKMDHAICRRFYDLYDMKQPDKVMPMSIDRLGNSSVATLPTLMDLVKNKQLEEQTIEKGDVIMFASVGAGMNVNAMVYRV